MIRAPLSIGARQFVLVVHFDERRQTQLPRSALQPHEIRLLERRHDQSAASAPFARASKS